MGTRSQIQELTNNSEIENSRNKGHAKISEFTVFSATKSIFHKAVSVLTILKKKWVDLNLNNLPTNYFVVFISGHGHLLSALGRAHHGSHGNQGAHVPHSSCQGKCRLCTFSYMHA